MPSENAFAIIHFGNKIKYLELELYFIINLRKHTSQDIVYLYSSQDTPPEFINIVRPFVDKVAPFNDRGLTYKVDFISAYASFNTLRTCDFIYAYRLKEYKKVCIIESDLVIMGNIDSIFGLNTPAILNFGASSAQLNTNTFYKSDANILFQTCSTKSTMNGGVILIEPSMQKYREYENALPLIILNKCKYPNEALFEYVNRDGFYNLPIRYNLSHYLTLRLNQFGVGLENILVFHFNETDYKHLDIVKEKWLEKNSRNREIMRKYIVKKIPIFYFRDEIYLPNREKIEGLLGIADAEAEVPEAIAVNAASDIQINTHEVQNCIEPQLKVVVNKPYYIRGGRRKTKKNSTYIRKKMGRRKTCKRNMRKGKGIRRRQ